MEIYVLDMSANVLDIIDNIQSVIWTNQWFGQGDFELVVPATASYVDLLQKDRLLCRDKDYSVETFENVMLIENIKIAADPEAGDTITVSGKSLKSILSRRVVWNQMTLSGNVEASIRKVITDNVINPKLKVRKIDNFILGDLAGISDTLETQLLGENLAEWLESISNTYQFGWDVCIRSGKFVFSLKKGADRSYKQTENLPVVFSCEFDNLLASTYSYERAEYKNAALIGGEGEGTEKRTASVGDTSGCDRFETYIDGSGVSSNGTIITVEQYTKLLEDYGKDQLSTASYTESFEGNVISDGNYTLGKDFFLGDVVQVANEFGIQATPRIIEIIESEDENGTSIVPTFSTWEVA